MTNSIDLRQFRYFLAVSEELNFRMAAQKLHISQPPLSRQIRLLEEQLGVELFIRSKTGVTLTAAGAAFLPEVKRTLSHAEKAISVAKAAKHDTGGHFIAGYSTAFDHSVIHDVFDCLSRKFPDWRITHKGKHSISLIRDIKKASLDVALVSLYTDTLDLEVETLLEDPFVVALSSHHRLAKKRKLSFDDIRDETLFWFERRINPGFYDHCTRFFERIDFRPNIIPEPSDHQVLLGLIAQGKGIALIPASLRKVKYQGVVFREMKEEREKLRVGIAVVYSKSNTSAVLPTFLKSIKQKY